MQPAHQGRINEIMPPGHPTARPAGARAPRVPCPMAVTPRDLGGDALRHFGSTPVSFGGAWRLGELVFRILFKGDGKRQPQVTVKLRPPGVVQFRRTQHEARVMKLIERNGLMNDRDDFEVVDAAE